MALVCVLTLAAGLRFWGLQFGFPNASARTDEEVIVDVGLGVLHDPNPHFFDWPTLFMYGVGAAYGALFAAERLVGGPMHNAVVANAFHLTTLHLVARALSAACGTISVALLYGAARELFPRRLALVAAALLAVVYLHARDSHFGVTDVAATMMMLAAWWAGLRCATRGASTRRLAIAGVLAGLAASTKYNTALVLLTPLVALGRDAADDPRDAMRAFAGAATVAAAFAVGFLAGTPYAVLDFPSFAKAVAAVRSHLAGGHVIMTARGWTYHAAFTLRYGVGAPLLVAAVAGACWLALAMPLEGALTLAVPIAYYAVLGSGRTVFARYMIPVVPFVCLAAAFCVERTATAIGRAAPRAAAAAAAAGLLILGAPTLRATIAFDRLMAATDSRVLAAAWIESSSPAGATLYQSGFGGGHLQPSPADRYLGYQFNERLTRFEVGGVPSTTPPDYIVLPESPLFAYSRVPDPIRAIVGSTYEPVAVVEGTPEPSPAVQYDLEDAFFAPYVGLDQAVRPGPTVRIYRRRM